LVDSLLARISFVDGQLIDCKLQSNEIMSMNKRLISRMNECELVIQKNYQLLDNLFFSNDPVTKDGYVSNPINISRIINLLIFF
jgi:hypothetical protein